MIFVKIYTVDFLPLEEPAPLPCGLVYKAIILLVNALYYYEFLQGYNA